MGANAREKRQLFFLGHHGSSYDLFNSHILENIAGAALGANNIDLIKRKKELFYRTIERSFHFYEHQGHRNRNVVESILIGLATPELGFFDDPRSVDVLLRLQEPLTKKSSFDTDGFIDLFLHRFFTHQDVSYHPNAEAALERIMHERGREIYLGLLRWEADDSRSKRQIAKYLYQRIEEAYPELNKRMNLKSGKYKLNYRCTKFFSTGFKRE